MSGKEKGDEEGFISKLITSIIVAILLGLIVIVSYAMKALWFYAKKPISTALKLEALSPSWPICKWLYVGIKWAAGFMFFVAMVAFASDVNFIAGTTDKAIKLARPMIGGSPVIDGILLFFVSMFFSLLYNIIDWIEQYYYDPETRKKLSGIKAEKCVQTLLNGSRQKHPESLALHGVLLIFKARTSDEFSIELDHILITQRNIFVVETKCKSGTIYAEAGAEQWQVTSPSGQSTMRNALKQCKNACRVLEQQFDLPCTPIPLVAIKGNDVTIVNAPGNVLDAMRVTNAIDGFERNQQEIRVNPQTIMAKISQCIATDTQAKKRHIERAEMARHKSELTHIVKTASLNITH